MDVEKESNNGSLDPWRKSLKEGCSRKGAENRPPEVPFSATFSKVYRL